MSNHSVAEVWDVTNSVKQLNIIAENIVEQVTPNLNVAKCNAPNQEYVNAVVFNEAGDALIIEMPGTQQAVGKWSMIETMICDSDDPLTAVQRALLEKTGYSTSTWHYIGTYLRDGGGFEGAGHIFVAHAAKKCDSSEEDKESGARWISIEELRYGLLDGRILSFRYALNVALALLTFID